MLWLRSLDQLEARPLGGTTGAQFPFWSPDSRQVAYLTSTALWRIGLDGSPPAVIASYRFSKGGRTPGGVWRPDDTIVFSPAATGSNLLSVPAQGGEFTTFYERDAKVEGDFHRPALLPDGRTLIFVVDRVQTGADTIGLLSNGTRKDLLTLEGEVLDSPVFSPSGYILYHRETTTPGVWALPFSFTRLEVTGSPFLIAPQGSDPSISANDLLIYAEQSVSGLATLAWLDVPTGAVTRALNEQFPAMTQPRVSPDGQRVAAVVQVPDQGQIVIVADLQRHTYLRLGDRADNNTRPTWRDNRTLVFARPDESIVMRPADGSGAETVLTSGMQPNVSGGRLVFTRLSPGVGGGLYHLLLPPGAGPPGKDELLQQLPVHEWEPALSPDGTLLAFTQGDAGQSEVILRTFPNETGRWQVSSNGGSNAVWSPGGDALYYKDVAGQIMRVDVRSSPAVSLGTPRHVDRPANLLARGGFDVSPDGTRLLMVQETKTDEQRAVSLAVVQNWLAEFGK
jgi:Tol biopolymer transport system component